MTRMLQCVGVLFICVCVWGGGWVGEGEGAVVGNPLHHLSLDG